MSANKSKWIWYYGDFELFHSLRLNLRRKERNYMYPAFWKLDDCYHSVKFKKEVNILKTETICVIANGIGNIEIDGMRYPVGENITLREGSHTLTISVANADGLPCAYVIGDTVVSDESWLVSYCGNAWVNAGCSPDYSDENANPEIFKFSYREIFPIEKKLHSNGILYDFGQETFALLRFSKMKNAISIFYGESEQEALDLESCYLYDDVTPNDIGKNLPPRAFRYLFIPEAQADDFDFSVFYEYLPVQPKGTFKCSNERINKIWDVAAYTFHLNSREFFLDGIKRDRWVWSGDAYQSYLINRYLFFDEEISKRTIIALRGKDPVEQHINTILDYSFYWIMSVYDYYETTSDKAFLSFIYPRMASLMDFCLSRLDENGFAQKVDDDWIFIDWADIDKTGAVCAEQMLLLKSLESMVECGKILSIDETVYQQTANVLKGKINDYYWNEEKGAFIDSFESGRNHVTRHANIFALLFNYASEHQRNAIIQNVILNDNIPQIKTPYFKFYVLEAMCEIGKLNYVTEQMISYWGGMLSLGATSFWEEYNPDLPYAEQFEMYGNKYGKSLCHAWGASPIYLIGKYYLGVKPTSPSYETFVVEPKLGGLEWMDGVVPIKDGKVSVKLKDNRLEVTSSKTGGTLIYCSQKYQLKKDIPFSIEL